MCKKSRQSPHGVIIKYNKHCEAEYRRIDDTAQYFILVVQAVPSLATVLRQSSALCSDALIGGAVSGAVAGALVEDAPGR